MAELLNKISSDNLMLVCVVMSVIALSLAIAVSIELFGRRRKKRVVEKVIDKEENINIKKDDNITYVEEDDELEKTAAKLELAKLKERLEKEETEKKKLLEINLALVTNKEKELEKKNESSVKAEEVVNNAKEENVAVTTLEATKEDKQEVEILDEEDDYVDRNSLYEELEEENAIISYDELRKSASFGYTDEEMDKYVDEKDAIISIEELEKLYKESNEMEEEIPVFDIKRVEDLPEISDEKKFQSTPFISPVYGIGVTEESIQLEQTANLEKLNEEIRKTNEFLKTLKELKKNLQ